MSWTRQRTTSWPKSARYATDRARMWPSMPQASKLGLTKPSWQFEQEGLLSTSRSGRKRLHCSPTTWYSRNESIWGSLRMSKVTSERLSTQLLRVRTGPFLIQDTEVDTSTDSNRAIESRVHDNKENQARRGRGKRVQDLDKRQGQSCENSGGGCSVVFCGGACLLCWVLWRTK